MSEERVEALRRALLVTPEDPVLRAMLAEALQRAGREAESLTEWQRLLAKGQVPADELVALGLRAVEAGRWTLAEECLGAARHAGVVHVEALAQAVARREAREKVPAQGGPAAPREGKAAPPPVDRSVTFADLGGLDELKKVVHRAILLPLQRPELYAKYGRKAGGGVLLYGPPGCGKTLLARATAGESGLPFVNVRIEDVAEMWFGASERNLHEAFDRARASAPCVVFVDEIDALAFSRRRNQGAGRQLVDQILQELDAIGGGSDGLLVLAATNAPWDVDDALLRPGRFDRAVFVPPPDAPARASILKLHLRAVPHRDVDVTALAAKTPLWSGADLAELVRRAVDQAIDEALSSGTEPPITGKALLALVATMRPSTLEWLARARNYVEFANDGHAWDEVARFLESPEVRAARR